MNDGAPPLVLRRDEGRVCTLMLNRPDKRNAVNPPLFVQLHEHLHSLRSDPSDLGIIVLRGAGKSFCAGHDLSEVGHMDLAWLRHESRTLEMLAQLPQIVIAAVHGHCFTGGLELALAADFIVCTESAQFADTHARYGLVPAWGLTQRLPRRIGASRSIELIATGRRIDGREAERIGLANTCFVDDAFETGLSQMCTAILANSPHSNAVSKRLIHDTDGMSLREGMAHEQFRSPGAQPRDPASN